MESATSRGIFSPKGTPQEHIDTLASAFEKALDNEELQQRLINELGSVPLFLQGQEYRDFLSTNEEALIQAAGNIEF